MRGESSVSYSISVNGDVESFIDSLAPDDGQFESMVKRTVLVLTAPVVIPMQNLQSAIFNKRLSRRNTATADYETEAAFTVSIPSETKTLRLAEEFRISRKNSFDSKLEFLCRVGRTARGEGGKGHALMILRPEELGFLR